MQRRTFFKNLLAAPSVSLVAADISDPVKGLPPLTIKEVKAITTNNGGNYRLSARRSEGARPEWGRDESVNTCHQAARIFGPDSRHCFPRHHRKRNDEGACRIGPDDDRVTAFALISTMGQYGPGSPGNHGISGRYGNDESLSYRFQNPAPGSNPPLSATFLQWTRHHALCTDAADENRGIRPSTSVG
jgi:hypothetical protein